MSLFGRREGDSAEVLAALVVVGVAREVCMSRYSDSTAGLGGAIKENERSEGRRCEVCQRRLTRHPKLGQSPVTMCRNCEEAQQSKQGANYGR